MLEWGGGLSGVGRGVKRLELNERGSKAPVEEGVQLVSARRVGGGGGDYGGGGVQTFKIQKNLSRREIVSPKLSVLVNSIPREGLSVIEHAKNCIKIDHRAFFNAITTNLM